MQSDIYQWRIMGGGGGGGGGEIFSSGRGGGGWGLNKSLPWRMGEGLLEKGASLFEIYTKIDA